MPKIGDKVYIVPDDTRNVPYYRTVISIGRKYITINDNSSCNKFDILTKYSVCDRNGWNPRLQLYESKTEYDKQLALQLRKNKLQYEIKNLIQTASIEKLESIYLLLKS